MNSIVNDTSSTGFPPIRADFEWDTFAVVKTIVFTVVTVCTSFGNLFVLLAVGLKRQHLHLSTHYLIANLAFADFLVGTCVMPFLASYTITERWYFGQTFCTIWTCIHFWICAASILSITAVCLDRYIGVQYPLHHFRMMDTKKIRMLSAFVWTLAGLLSIIPIFIWPEPSLPEDDIYVCKVNHQLGHVIVVSIFIFYIPLGAMLVLYWKIYQIAIKHLKGVQEGYKQYHDQDGSSSGGMRIHSGGRSNSNSTESTDTNSKGTYSDSEAEQKEGDAILTGEKEKDIMAINFQRQSKTAKKVSVIVGAFVLSYFPFFTAFLVKGLDRNSISLEALIMMAWLRYFNSCLNPLIYAVMLKQFRKAFLSMYQQLVGRE